MSGGRVASPAAQSLAVELIEAAWAADQSPVMGSIASQSGLTVDQVSNLIGELANSRLKAGKRILGRPARPAPQASTGPPPAKAAPPEQPQAGAPQAGPVDTPPAEGWRAAEDHPIPEIAAAYARAANAIADVERLLAPSGPIADARDQLTAALAALDAAAARWAEVVGEAAADAP